MRLRTVVARYAIGAGSRRTAAGRRGRRRIVAAGAAQFLGVVGSDGVPGADAPTTSNWPIEREARRFPGRASGRSTSGSTTRWGRSSPRPTLEHPAASLGHYYVATVGDANGARLERQREPAHHRGLRGAVDYSQTTAQWSGLGDGVGAAWFGTTEPERFHDLTTSLETHIPQTATRVYVLYPDQHRLRTAGLRPTIESGLDSRFDVQVNQALPFMGFTSADWEVLRGGPEPVPRSDERTVGLRRTARRASTNAHRRRCSSPVLADAPAAVRPFPGPIMESRTLKRRSGFPDFPWNPLEPRLCKSSEQYRSYLQFKNARTRWSVVCRLLDHLS